MGSQYTKLIDHKADEEIGTFKLFVLTFSPSSSPTCRSKDDLIIINYWENMERSIYLKNRIFFIVLIWSNQ